MRIRAIDADHDWQFGKGKQSYLSENDAIAQNIQTRLLEFLNDCFFNMSAGIDWFRLLGSKSTEQEILLNVRAVILRSYGVVRINYLSSVYIGRNLSITYNIDTLYTSQFSQNLEVLNA